MAISASNRDRWARLAAVAFLLLCGLMLFRAAQLTRLVILNAQSAKLSPWLVMRDGEVAFPEPVVLHAGIPFLSITWAIEIYGHFVRIGLSLVFALGAAIAAVGLWRGRFWGYRVSAAMCGVAIIGPIVSLYFNEHELLPFDPMVLYGTRLVSMCVYAILAWWFWKNGRTTAAPIASSATAE